MSKQRKDDAPAEIALPVTPMLDMTFQLMFFFLATFTPSSAKEGQLDLRLPATGAEAARPQSPVDPQQEKPDESLVVSIKLRGQKDPRHRGKLSYLTINIDNTVDEEIKGTIEERERVLTEKLEKVKPAEALGRDGKKKPPTVRMAAESELHWAQVMKIMDVCYRTGYQVSFVKPSDPGDNR